MNKKGCYCPPCQTGTGGAMSDRRYGAYIRLVTGVEWPLSFIPDALVEEAAKRLRAKSGIRLFDYETIDEIDDLARAALSVLFPGEEEE